MKVLNLSKLVFALVLAVFVSGCAGIMAGNYTETPILLNDGTVAKTRLGTVIKDKKRTARSVAIMQSAAVAIENMKTSQPVNKCLTLTFEQMNQLKAAAQAAYIQGANNCNLFAAMERTVSQALGRPQSPQEAVARQFVSAVRASEDGLTGRVKAVVNPLALGITVKSVSSDLASKSNNTTVGNISQSSGSGSRGVTGGAAGEGAGGAGSETATANQNIIIGDGNSTNTAFDSARAGENNLNPSDSANGSINTGKTQGSPVADENNGDATVNDEDGLNL